MSAILSDCGTYRFRLERHLSEDGRAYAFFGINPSTADASINDATVRKWLGFCRQWRVGRFIVGNVSPFRATSVSELMTHRLPPEIFRLNLTHIGRIIDEADVLVPCWGDRAKVPKSMHFDIDQVLGMLVDSGKPVRHFGLTKGGDPKHPLMLGYSTPLVDWPASTLPCRPARPDLPKMFEYEEPKT